MSRFYFKLEDDDGKVVAESLDLSDTTGVWKEAVHTCSGMIRDLGRSDQPHARLAMNAGDESGRTVCTVAFSADLLA